MGMIRTRQQPAPMYRRLPHGPSGMAREEVQRNQRSRLYGAMIEAVSRNGFLDTTVADVIALAGVSRRAFYELFANKEECFLRTYDVMVAQARRRLLHGWLSERGWANRMHSSCQSLLGGIARAPKGPRLVLVDALGIGPRARERMQLAGLVFERSVASAFSLAPEDVCYPQLTSRVVVSGVRNIVFNRLLERRHRELAELSDEVLDWIESYRMPAGAKLRNLTLARSEHLPPVPAAFLTREGKRARMLGSVVHLTLDQGYAALTDAQIAEFAGVSTEAFHRQFAGKEECFLAVLDEFVAETLECVRPAMEGAASWEQAVCQTIDAFVTHLVARCALLRIAFINLFEVGPAMIGRMTRSVEGFTAMLTEQGPAPMRAPLIAQEAVTGALWGVIATFVSNNRLSRLPPLADHLAFTVLAPYVGPRAAIEALADRQRRPAAA
ncbi:MAG TPA: TetR/AcrR family transcriptional regulator [Solirubrobacteraceae bacterium]|jgi:AcrR family transcriptional regulator|nr:TetR/AcrR family transcriptional regulator [Solirubrobacteraceae bacterium]